MAVFGDKIPVTLLTGYLGSGKTTVLNRLLRSPALKRTAVIVNEFGEIGIDHDLIEGGSERTVVLPGGCVCCSVRSDLADTLRSLFQRRVRGQVAAFERAVIETTGLADPAPILQTLITDPLVAARFHLDGVITTVDAVNGWDTLERSAEAVKQAAIADQLLLTKTDIADSGMTTRLTDRLHALNPAASIIRTHDGIADPNMLFGVGPIDRFKVIDGAHDHRRDGQIRSFCVTRDQPISADRLEEWMKRLTKVAGPDLLRVKGLVNIVDSIGPLVVHGVQHIFHPPFALAAWPSADRRTRIVFITRDLEEQAIREMLIR